VPTALSAAPGTDGVELAERVHPYARFFAVEEHRLRHPRFDGGMSEPVERSVFASGDAVTVLPFDPRAGTVLLIEQFRAGPWARKDPRPWCLETVAGRSDRAEPPEATARREAVEEAGLTLGRLERIAAYYPSPGIASEYIVGFVGEADLGGAGGRTHGLAEEQEDIRTLVVPLERAMAAFASGEIRNAPLIISLLWLDRHAARLRLAWA
jgi:nudix-type nucleoside diphosphatase (YffH/AdpP family)